MPTEAYVIAGVPERLVIAHKTYVVKLLKKWCNEPCVLDKLAFTSSGDEWLVYNKEEIL